MTISSMLLAFFLSMPGNEEESTKPWTVKILRADGTPFRDVIISRVDVINNQLVFVADPKAQDIQGPVLSTPTQAPFIPIPDAAPDVKP